MHRPSDRDVNWMSPLQGESPLVQVKEPYGNFDMVTCIGFHPAIWSVQSTPANNTRKRVCQYIEKERKKKDVKEVAYKGLVCPILEYMYGMVQCVVLQACKSALSNL